MKVYMVFLPLVFLFFTTLIFSASYKDMTMIPSALATSGTLCNFASFLDECLNINDNLVKIFIIYDSNNLKSVQYMPSNPNTLPDQYMPSNPNTLPDQYMPSNPNTLPDQYMPSNPNTLPDQYMPSNPNTLPDLSTIPETLRQKIMEKRQHFDNMEQILLMASPEQQQEMIAYAQESLYQDIAKFAPQDQSSYITMLKLSMSPNLAKLILLPILN